MSDTHDPIRPAHYRDATGRDRIAVWAEMLEPDELTAACIATADRYLSRAGRKPGTTAEQDRAKAIEVLRRFAEEWGEGAWAESYDMLTRLGHNGGIVRAIIRESEQPRDTTPQDDAPAVTTVGEWCAEEWARDAALQLLPQGWKMRPGKHGFPEFVGSNGDRPAAIVWRGGNTSWRWAFDDPQDRSREVACAIDGIREADAALRAAPELTAEGRALLGMPTAPQANPLAGVTPLPPGRYWEPRDGVEAEIGPVIVINGKGGGVMVRIGTLAGILAYVEKHAPGMLPHGWPAAQDDHAGVALRLTPNELHALAWLVVRAGGFTAAERAAEHAIISAAQRCGWPNEAQPSPAQDDHAAALQRERERADRAERALRIERGAPLPGDLPEGWTKRVTSELWWYAHPHADYDDAFDAEARRNLSGRWEWWATDDGHGGHRTTAAEAIDAAHAALTAQRSDDTARDDGSDSSASGEGDSALPPDGYDWHDGAGDTEVLTDEHEEAAAWITRSTLPGGADQWSWWLASDSAIGVEKDVRHESTWKAARIGVRRAIERRRSDSSAQRSAEGGEA